MNCFDCAVQDRLERRAIGICHDCGAAMCESHSVVRVQHRTRLVPLLLEEPVEPPARILRCTTCDGAYVAARQPTAGVGRHHRGT